MWLVFTLVTTLLWGAAELFYKKGSHEERKYDHLRVCVLVGAVMGIHAIFTLLTSDISYNPMNLIAYLPVSLCYILSMACSFFGIRFIEESLADPI
jgi:ABC-type xylose transport system permease subunit